MAVVANLDVVLGAITTKFDRGMTKARASLKAFAKDVGISGGLVNRFFSPGGAALVGIGIFANQMRRAVSEVDRLSEASQKLGISATSLMAFEAAAEAAGIETGKLDKALTTMERRISEATLSKPVKAAAEAFKALGLSAKELRLLTPEEVFKRIADALPNLQNQFDRTRIAMELFGKGGADIVRILDRKQIEEMQALIAVFGGTITADLEQSVGAADAAWAKMKLAGQSLRIGLLSNLQPIIDGFTRFSVVVTQNAQPIFTFLRRVESAINPLKSLADLLRLLPKPVADVGKAADNTKAAMDEFLEVQKKFKKFVHDKALAEQTARHLRDAELLAEVRDLDKELNGPLTAMDEYEEHLKNIDRLLRAGALDPAKAFDFRERAFDITVGEEERRRIEDSMREMEELREKGRMAELELIDKRKDAIEDELDKRIDVLKAEARVDTAPAAIEAGTAAAFSAFRRASKDSVLSDKILVEQRRAREALERLDKRAAFLKRAELK